jgi:hypothetical protein
LCGSVVLAVSLGVAPAAAQPPQTTRDLVRADAATLDALFASGSAGPVPTGFLPGRAIPEPGSVATERKSRRIGMLWKGKVFHADGSAHNRVFRMNAVPMKLYHGESLHDGGPAIIIDYADSWRVFSNVRDELREVSPGLYLGRTFVRDGGGYRQTMMFALQAPDGRR